MSQDSLDKLEKFIVPLIKKLTNINRCLTDINQHYSRTLYVQS